MDCSKNGLTSNERFDSAIISRAEPSRAEAMTTPRLREQHRPPSPPDRRPPRRGGGSSPSIYAESAAVLPAGPGCLRDARRGLVRSARALAAAALLALSGALALPAAAQAQEIALVSNISESGTQVTFVTPVGFQLGGIDSGETRISQRFTTGPNTAGYSLQSVVLNLGTNLGSGSVVQVAIHEESSGNPGTLLGVLDNPADPFGDNPATAGNRTFSAPSALSLDANTNYWVVLRDTTSATGANNYRVRLTTSNNETTTHGFSISNGHQAGTPGNWSENTLSVVKMEVRGTLAPPTVTSVVVASAPQSGDTYRSYETIRFTVTFSEPVEVKPHGRLRLKVGLDNPGGASGSTVEAVFSGQSKSERPTADTPQVSVSRHLHFEYKVQLFDRDEDGVRIGANALRLASGARIQGEGGGDADLDHPAYGTQSDHKVDGTADVPMIERIEVVSTPRLTSKGTTNRDTYGEGETIRIEVRFDQPVVVEGEPTFALEVGNPCRAVCEAYYESGSGTDTLVFAYLVLEVDIDRNGIAIRGNPIEVVSGDSIRNAADQEAHLSSKGKGTQRGHKVDGSRAAGPHLSVEDAEAHEADGEMEFTVRLEPHGLGIVTVDYATADGSGDTGAVAGEDYTETRGTLTFNPLETERTVSVPVMDDAHEDDGETFTLTLSNPDGARFRGGDHEATGTIHNSDPPAVSVSDASATEGDTIEFTVSLSAASGRQVTVQYATSDGTAESGTDFTATSGTLTFAAKETSKTVSVPTTGDSEEEEDETFALTLSNPADATLGDATATGTIVDDDESPPPIPGKPQAPTVSAATPNSLTVEWTEPENDGPPVTDYDVQYWEGGSGGFIDAQHEGTARIATLTGLSPDTVYEVQVRASNANGTGAWSESSEGRSSLPQAGGQIYYFPHLAVGAGWQTTITYINYSSEEVSCRTEFLSDDGTPLLVSFADRGTVPSRTDVLLPGGSVHQETNVALSAPLAPGWARATCSGPLKASLLYRRFEGGAPTGEAGVNATTVPATRFVTFAEQGEGQLGTAVAYANPSDTQADITFTVRDEDGLTLASDGLMLSPNGHGAANMVDLFDLSSFSGSLEVTSTEPIVTLSLNAEANPIFSSLPPGDLDAAAQGPQEMTTYYFPHLAVGDGWQTTITYINYSPEEVSCRTEFLSDHGSPLMVSFAGLGTVVSRPDVLPPGGSVHEETNVELHAPAALGWARATCSGPVKASLLFRQYDSEGLPVAEAAVNATTVPATRFVTFAEQGEGKFGTAVAYANPSATAALVTFTVRDAAGEMLASVDRSLLAGGHDAQNMVDLFGLPSFTGSLEITSTAPIVTLSLNNEAAPVFSSLPPGEVDAAAP